MQKPATAVELSRNAKLGSVSATYASQASCPSSCPFRNNGCYAESSHVGIQTHRLNKSPIDIPIEVAEFEAAEIDGLTGTRPLRLHVVGDATTDQCASVLAGAAERHTAKHGKPVWTYTHAHDVERESWGGVSVLRSCETLEQVEQAFDDGYAAAMVVSEFKQDTAYPLADGIMGIPCPEMTGKAESCVKCGLCMQDGKLRDKRRVILFAAHGASKKRVQNSLRVMA